MKLSQSQSKLSNTALKILHCTLNIAHCMSGMSTIQALRGWFLKYRKHYRRETFWYDQSFKVEHEIFHVFGRFSSLS